MTTLITTTTTLPLEEYYDLAVKDLRDLIRDIGSKRKVKDIRVNSRDCNTYSPCNGHRGITIIFDMDSNNVAINRMKRFCVDSVTTGVIMWYYGIQNKYSDHFLYYVKENELKPFLLREGIIKR